MTEKDVNAVALGVKRWAKKTKAEKRAHAQYMNDIRWAEHRRKKAKKGERDA